MSANRRAGSKKKPASKARASGTKGARSRAARKGASGAKSKRASTRDPKASLFSRLLRLVLLLAGLGLGLLVPWTLWLNHLIDRGGSLRGHFDSGRQPARRFLDCWHGRHVVRRAQAPG